MDAVQFVDHGDRGVVAYGSYPVPLVGAGEVLVRDVLSLNGTARENELLEGRESSGEVVVPDGECEARTDE